MTARFQVELVKQGASRTIAVTGPDGTRRRYHIPDAEQHKGYLDAFAAIAADFGTRVPRNRRPQSAPDFQAEYRPLLTENISPRILYGYGDPAVRWVEEEQAWYMTVTSNDAPDAAPILKSGDLAQWECVGFGFPEGCAPGWMETRPGVADFWAPELVRVNGEWLLSFTAREHDDSLSIGIAKASAPAGPFERPSAPLLRGDVIDAHIFHAPDGTLILFWKEDSNRTWPRRIAELMHRDPGLIERLFESEADRRTAALAAALWPCLREPAHMEVFFSLQPLIEAAIDNFTRLRNELEAIGTAEAMEAHRAMRTPIHAQRLGPDGASLIGEPRGVLENDLHWEAHLIEGPWLTFQNGRYWLFYAGNDFSTADYGVGVAVADDPMGPFEKLPEPLLRSTGQWEGPGHPSVARGPDGEPAIFFHAFFPGRAGYKEFRALLMARLRFGTDRVELLPGNPLPHRSC